MKEHEVNLAAVPVAIEKATDAHIETLYQEVRPEELDEKNLEDDKVIKTPEENKEEVKAEEKKLVPYDALHEERQRRKELKKQLDDRDSNYNQLQTSVVTLLERLTPKEQENTPDYSLDPLGAIQHHITKLNERVAKIDEYKNAEATKNQAFQEEQEFVTKYQSSAREFAGKTPDFMEAYNFLVASRVDELKSAGFTEEEAKREAVKNERIIAEKAYNDEVNPAERMYQLAQKRGYSKKDSASADKIQQMDKGLKASQTLHGGAKSDGDVSIDSLNAAELAMLSDAEFDELFNKASKKR